MVLLLWRSAVAAEAVRWGLTLCARSVIPALFPYFVVSGLFISLGFADGVGRRLEPLIRRLFGVGGAGASAFFLGLLGGYPVGGRTVGQLYRAGRLSKDEAERLLAFCNNAGPSFILGVVGAGCFGSLRTGIYLYLPFRQFWWEFCSEKKPRYRGKKSGIPRLLSPSQPLCAPWGRRRRGWCGCAALWCFSLLF